MAKVTLNPAIKALSGKQGSLVYRNVRGRTVAALTPKEEERPASPAQAARRLRFKLATIYAREVLDDPCQRRAYEALARQRDRRADKLLTSDFLTPPVVDEIDLSGYRGQPGDLVRVRASDDIEVVSVQVSIRTAGGTVIEEGAAVPRHGVWRYTATIAAPAERPLVVEVNATDRPGNATSGSLSYQ